MEPWEVLQVGVMKIGATSVAGNECVLLVVDRASKHPFDFPLPTKKTDRVGANSFSYV